MSTKPNIFKTIALTVLILVIAIVAGVSICKKDAQAKEYVGQDREDAIYLLSHIIMGEAESGSWELKIGVGSVVLNRVNDDRFPNTIEEVIFQKGQYAPTWDGRYYLEPNEECVKAAEYLVENGTQYPDDIIWQAEFKQGAYVYEQIEGMYFCGS